MNYVFISPNYPTINYKYCQALAARGITVLGVGDTPYDALDERLKRALTEYYFVGDLNNFSSQVAALTYFQWKYGQIDYLESNNEWWLNTDAQLRAQFNIQGSLMPSDMEGIKAKSAMKEFFARAGAKTIRHILYKDRNDERALRDFVAKVGYPIFAKPNIGVGAGDSHSIKNEQELRGFLEKTLPEPYIVEEYIDGVIVSFDGVCDGDSNVVFATSDHFPTPIADIVNKRLDYCYYDIPFGLEMDDIDAKEFFETGKRVVKSFGIRKRMFHIEFFVLGSDRPGLGKKGDFVALECNMRAPGGYTPDLMNFGNSLSMYDVYADVIAYNENRQKPGSRPYYAIASHRKNCFQYKYSWGDIYGKYNDRICDSGSYPTGIKEVMGDEYIFAKFENLEDALEFDKMFREHA